MDILVRGGWLGPRIGHQKPIMIPTITEPLPLLRLRPRSQLLQQPQTRDLHKGRNPILANRITANKMIENERDHPKLRPWIVMGPKI